MRVEEKQLVHESTLYVRRAYMRESPRKGVIPMCVYYEWGELLVKQLKGERVTNTILPSPSYQPLAAQQAAKWRTFLWSWFSSTM